MAFTNKIGSLLKCAVTSNTASPSVLQAIRSMSSSKVFVGGVSYNTDDMSLKEAFSSYGEVIEARIIMDRETGRSRGFGFVTFTSTEEASAALAAMDGKMTSEHVEVEAAKLLGKLIQESKDEPAKLAMKLHVICQHMRSSGKRSSHFHIKLYLDLCLPLSGYTCHSKAQVMHLNEIEKNSGQMSGLTNSEYNEEQELDGQVTTPKSSSRATRNHNQRTIQFGDSPAWLPSGWIMEIRTSQLGA